MTIKQYSADIVQRGEILKDDLVVYRGALYKSLKDFNKSLPTNTQDYELQGLYDENKVISISMSNIADNNTYFGNQTYPEYGDIEIAGVGLNGRKVTIFHLNTQIPPVITGAVMDTATSANYLTASDDPTTSIVNAIVFESDGEVVKYSISHPSTGIADYRKRSGIRKSVSYAGVLGEKHLNALGELLADFKRNGIENKIIEVVPFATNDNTIGVVKLKYASGGTPAPSVIPVNNIYFTDKGLKSDLVNGGSTLWGYVRSGFVPSDHFGALAASEVGVSFIQIAEFFTNTDKYPIGGGDGTNFITFSQRSQAGTAYTQGYNGWLNSPKTARNVYQYPSDNFMLTLQGDGFWMDGKLTKNDTFNTIVPPAGKPTKELFYLVENQNGNPSTLVNVVTGALCAVVYHQKMTAAEMEKFNAAMWSYMISAKGFSKRNIHHGDSIAYGRGDTVVGGWPRRYGTLVNKVAVDRGFPGETLKQFDGYAINYIESYDARIHNKLFISYGTNDVTDGTTAAIYKTMLKRDIGLAKAKGWPASSIVITSPPYRWNDDNATLNTAYKDVVMSLPAEDGVLAVDVLTPMRNYPGGGNLLLTSAVDVLHPNPTGHAFIASTVNAAIAA